MTRKIDYLVVHCSATKAKSNITATDIDKWHRARGFFGCGYHYVITRDGTVQSHAKGDKCRPLDMPGAHVGDCGLGWNKRSIGICMVGGLDAEGLVFDGVDQALAVPGTDLRLFGKPESFVKRRMGVALARAGDVEQARVNAKLAASKVKPRQP